MNPSAQRWEQVCENTDDDDSVVANRRLAALGADGFELVSMSIEADNDLVFCVKRPVAR